MSTDNNPFDLQGPSELQALLDRLCEGRIDPSGLDRLQQLVVESAGALQYYRSYVQLHGMLRATAGAGLPDAAGLPRLESAPPSAGAGSHPAGAPLSFPAIIVNLSAAWLTSPKALALTVVGGLLTYFVALAVSIAISRTAWVDRDQRRSGALPKRRPELSAPTRHGGEIERIQGTSPPTLWSASRTWRVGLSTSSLPREPWSRSKARPTLCRNPETASV